MCFFVFIGIAYYTRTMINFLSGTVQDIHERAITLFVSGFGLHINTPRPELFAVGEATKVCAYMHWNSDKGPSLFGFADEVDKQLFLHIIDCPKIGPKIGLAILSQMPSVQFIDAVRSQNVKALSSVSGVGIKKAEQIITSLKDKITKLVTTGKISVAAVSQDGTDWSSLGDALSSLGYTKQEVSSTLQRLAKEPTADASFDVLLRSALSMLAQN